MIPRPQIELREHGDRVCRVCGLHRCRFVLLRLATPTIHPFALLHCCSDCLGVVRELFRWGTGRSVVGMDRAVTLTERNAVMVACQVCAFEAVTHGLVIDEDCVLQMCSHCGRAIRRAVCAAESSQIRT